MYITRKVYSQAEDIETGEVKLFSVNDVTLDNCYDERTYSVMMDENELSLFSDFCNYYEALYSEEAKEQEQEPAPKKGMSKGAKIAIGTGASLASIAAAAYAAKKGWLGKAAKEQADKVYGRIAGKFKKKPAAPSETAK